MGVVKYHIKKNTYYDSVTLMLISKEVKKMEGVHEALVGMGTDLNKELATHLGISSEEIECSGVNDFFVSLLCEENIDINDIMDNVNKLLTQKKKSSSSDYKPATLRTAIKEERDSNLVIVSVPGQYAYEESKKALENNLHVMLFSDNVSLEEERKLKDLAVEKGLLMMGPDCGTAIINNIPLAFANVIRKGNIGIVGASGTGTQEVTVTIHRLGEGVSQVIGTGGRDLSFEIGGTMMLQGIEALMNDENTKVLVLISKPPEEKITEKILLTLKNSPKPVVVCFIGGDKELIKKYNAYPALSLEDAGRKAVALLRGEEVGDFHGFDTSHEEIKRIIESETFKMTSSQKDILGLYTGGTLAYESEIFFDKTQKFIDFGDDKYTKGRPHPMIDPSIRAEYLTKEGYSDNVAIVLLDFVIGYGAHEDPVGEMLPAITEAKAKMEEKGKYLSIIASICGTEEDPQNLMESKERLKEAGVIVMNSNIQATKLASLILDHIENRRDANV